MAIPTLADLQERSRSDKPVDGIPVGLSIEELERRGSAGPLEQTVDNRTLGDQFGSGFQQGALGVQQGLGGFLNLVGLETGSTAISDAGKSLINDSIDDAHNIVPPDVSKVEDIDDLADAISFAAQGLGQAVPSLFLSFAAGGVGGAIGKSVLKHSIKRTLASQAEKAIAGAAGTKAAKKAAIKKALNDPKNIPRFRTALLAGAGTGAFAASAVPQIGGTFEELKESGVAPRDAVKSALIAGGTGGLLDAAPIIRVMSRFFPGVGKKVAQGFIKDFAKEAGLQGLFEGGTEGLQELIALAAVAYHDPSFDITSDDAKSRVLNAFAVGAIAGVFTGGGGSVVSSAGNTVQRQASKRAEKVFASLQAATEATDTESNPGKTEFNAKMDEAGGEEVGPAETVFPSGREVSDALKAKMDPVFKQAKERVVTGLKRMGVMDSSVGAAHVGIVKQAMVGLDIAIAEKVTPMAEQIVADAQAEIAKAKELATPGEVATAIGNIRRQVAADLDNLFNNIIPRAVTEAEDAVGQQTEEFIKSGTVDFTDETSNNAAIEREVIAETQNVVATEDEGSSGEAIQRARRGDNTILLGEAITRDKVVASKARRSGEKVFKVVGRSKREIRQAPDGVGAVVVSDDLIPFKSEKKALEVAQRQARFFTLAEQFILGSTEVRTQSEALDFSANPAQEAREDSTAPFSFEVIKVDGGFAVQQLEQESVGRSEVGFTREGEVQPLAQLVATQMEEAINDAKGNPQGNVLMPLPDGSTVKMRLATLVGIEFSLQRVQDGSGFGKMEAARTLLGKLLILGVKVSPNSRIILTPDVWTVQEVLNGKRDTEKDKRVVSSKSKAEAQRNWEKRQKGEVEEGALNNTRSTTHHSDLGLSNLYGRLKKSQEDLKLANDQAERIEGVRRRERLKEITRAQAEAEIDSFEQVLRAPAALEQEIASLERQIENFDANTEFRQVTDPWMVGMDQGRGGSVDPKEGRVSYQHTQSGEMVAPEEDQVPFFDTLEAAQERIRALQAGEGAYNSQFDVIPVTVRDELSAALGRAENSLKSAGTDKQIDRFKKRIAALKKRFAKETQLKSALESAVAVVGRLNAFSKQTDFFKGPNLATQLEARTAAAELQQLVSRAGNAKAANDVVGYRVIESIFSSRNQADPAFDVDVFDADSELKPDNRRLPDTEEIQRARDARTFNVGTNLGKKVASAPTVLGQTDTINEHFPAPNQKAAVLDNKHQRGEHYTDEQFEQVIEQNEATVILGNVKVLFAKGRANGAANVARLLSDLANRLGMRNGINVIDDAGLDRVLASKLRSKQEQGAETVVKFLADIKKDKPPARAIFFKGQIIIYVSPKIASKGAPSGALEFAALGHEFGHAVFQVYAAKLSTESKMILWNAFVAENPGQAIGASESAVREADAAVDIDAAVAIEQADIEKATLQAFKENIAFEEWMANQFVGWLANQRRNTKANTAFDPEASAAVRGFFNRVKLKLMKTFDWLTEKFGVTESFEEFMQGVIAATEGKYDHNTFSRSFRQDGGGDYMGYTWFGELPKKRNFEAPPAPDGERMRHQGRFDGMKRRMGALSKAFKQGNLNLIKGEVVQAWRELLTTLNGRVREIASKYPALEELTSIMRPEPGQEGISFNIYKTSVVSIQQLRINRLAEKFSSEELAAAQAEIRSGTEPTTEAGKELLAFIQNFAKYLQNAGLPIRVLQNYFPRVLDTEAMLVDGAQEILVARYASMFNVKTEEARSAIGGIYQNADEASRQALAEESIEAARAQSNIANPYAGNMNKRKLTTEQYEKLFDGYMQTDTKTALDQYMPQMVRLAEFNRLLGDTTWNTPGQRRKFTPGLKLQEMMKEAKQQGMTDTEIDELEDIIDTWLGRRGLEISERERTISSWLMTYQNLRVLLFTVFASFPDLMTSVVRAGSLSTAYKGWRAYATEPHTREDLQAMGRTFGIISDHLNKSAVAEHFTATFMTEPAQKMNEKFFKATGLLMYTNFTRKVSLGIGLQYINEHAGLSRKGNVSESRLKEVGLTKAEVELWQRGGSRAYGEFGYTLEENTDPAKVKELKAAEKVKNAMFRFVDESVMRPDATQRPAWGSDPRWMLFFHLKSFMYTFYETTMKRVAFEARSRQGLDKLTPFMQISMLLPVTAIGLELREMIQYAGSGSWGTQDRQPRTDRMSGAEYMLELVERSGMAGPSQLALDLESADERNQFWLLGIAGPTAASAKELIFDPASQSVPKAIPIVSQLPWARDALRNLGN